MRFSGNIMIMILIGTWLGMLLLGKKEDMAMRWICRTKQCTSTFTICVRKRL